MVKLRLKRMGSKFNAFYRIVAADARAPRDGRFIEEIGYYNPNSKELKIEVTKKDKWLGEGAVPSETVKNLIKKFEKAGGTEGNTTVTLPIKVKKPKTTPVVKTPKTENEEVEVVVSEEETLEVKTNDTSAETKSTENQA